MTIFSNDFFEQLKKLVQDELTKKLEENPQYFSEVFNKAYNNIKDPNGLLDYGKLKDCELKREILPENIDLTEMDCKFSVYLKFESVFEVQNIENGENSHIFNDTPVEIPATITMDALGNLRLLLDDKGINADDMII